MIRDTFEPVNLMASTLRDLLSQYHSQLGSYSKSTQKTHQKTLYEFFKYFEDSHSFLFLPRDFEKYVEYLRMKNLSDNSVKTYMSCLRKFCEFLVDGFILEKNPAKRVRVSQIRTKFHHTVLSEEDIQILLWTLSAGDEVSIRDRLIVSLILYCGFSIEELSQIKLEQIDKKRKYWYINTDFPINHELNNNALPTNVVKSFEDHLEYMTDKDTEYLFVSNSNSSQNKQLTPRGLTGIIKGRLMQAGFDGTRFKYTTPSDLRTTSISTAIRTGARAKYLMKRYDIKHRATLEKYR